MDQIDYKILSSLHDNARMPISELSRMIAMSQPAVTERLRKLEDQGVITGYRAEISPRKLGKHTTSFVLFKTNNCKDFLAFTETSPEVIDLYRISGEYNYLMKVLTETTESLAAFLDACSAFGFSTPLIVLSTPFEDKSPVADRLSDEASQGKPEPVARGM
ncbi:Lrp/AsnC family transcriptional regulator [Paenibacillus mucilaginosus]|uniref:AsnC family transcriptional regulator n=3 Tax=Paenibacillus mucilaginosus TaxID=61624 RepID=H6NHZ1_9BACL|nr:Lrp/AsnC family transcriptional regulator [Paenibacillus mucilaginosus]AEI43085.1 transcriptional regulator, AsnC family [Paenibacillus mucilaginosus KNP414]AFC30762.1 AsnC family transcriptional regulator [Paenibacillus mucilaginosus 3016]AFH63085.1 AsnC family transcriptional regulator [Paenibacillus mucilaginosus K02]MCG7212340.1 Lrp/AsnC family transcriptional regulator [Paenibacillus mucilaginosus]WDM24702.1 Lrp/AsnC family transcriptional regulator [Paenibacillus mucilaginosus]